MNDYDTTTRMAGLLALTLGLTACFDQAPEPEPFELIEPVDEDAGPDADAADVGPDASPEEDTGPEVLREVVEARLFGDMPLNNGVKDPRFGSVGQAFTWIVQPTSNQGQLVSAIPSRPPGAPVDAPALRVLRDANTPRDVSAFGEVTLSRAPTTASVWMGRAEPEGATYREMEVQVIGLDLTDPGGFAGVTLTEEPDAQVRAGNVLWRRYSGTLTGFAGFGYLIAREPAGAEFYVLAPTVTPAPINPGALLAAPSPSRALTDQESDAVQRVIDDVTARRQQRFSQQQARMLPKDIGPIPVPAN
jgi:hypothetical protein